MAKKDYTKLEKDDLLKVIEKLESRKKYGLIWDEEKTKEQFEKESENALPVLKEVKGKEIKTDPSKPTNILIEGDNYHALSVLNYTHQGKIDVIYIDPPYNTGNKDFKYNDRFVDKEDSYRHSKWLSFMSKRLRLAKNLMKEDGVIFISIDDNEYAQLKLICDELFGEGNLETIIWHKVADDSGRLKITYRVRREHEYILVCYKNKDQVFFKKFLSDRNYKNEYTNPDNDPRGPYKQGIISTTEAKSKETGKNFYSIKTPSGKIISRQWRFPKEEFERLNKDNRIYYGKDGSSIPSEKVFINEQKATTPTTLFSDLGTAKTAGFEIENIFGNKPFTYPKPVTLIQHIIKIASDKDDLILDFMAGSGTTGHAVMQMNKEDKGKRNFILCTNNENNIATKVCYPRVVSVIKGYTTPKKEKVAGLGGNLKYYKTAFVKNSISRDDLKMRITRECTEMLCLREGIFDEVKAKPDYHIFEQNGRIMGVYYSMERDSLAQLKKELDKMEGEKILYCFTFDPLGLDKNDFADWQGVSLEPIPQKILDIYEQIYEY